MSFITGAIIAGSIAGGAGLIGSAISADASRSAANKQADAARAAQETQMAMFERNKADLAPWMQAGQQALGGLSGYLGVGPGGFDPNAPGVRPFSMADFQADPGYQFRLKEGMGALLNARSRIGGLGGGNTMRALMDYGQGLGAQEYQNAYTRYNNNIQNVYRRLAGMSNTGANTAGGIAGLGANAANQISEYQTQGGNAAAAGVLGPANALNAGIGSAGQQWLLAQALSQRGGQPGYGGYGGTVGDLQMQAAADPFYGGGGGWTSGYDLPMGY